MIGHEKRWGEIGEEVIEILCGNNYGVFFQDLDEPVKMSVDTWNLQYYQNGSCTGLHGITFPDMSLLLLLKNAYVPAYSFLGSKITKLHNEKQVYYEEVS